MLQERVSKDNMTYVDAIVDICAKKGIELESVPKLLTPKIRKIIQNEAITLNMLKPKSGKKLPI